MRRTHASWWLMLENSVGSVRVASWPIWWQPMHDKFLIDARY
jgi:hypothetical protein